MTPETIARAVRAVAGPTDACSPTTKRSTTGTVTCFSKRPPSAGEETGYDVEVETLTGTYTNPGHVMAYEDGEVRQQFSLAFRARLIGGEPKTSSESDRVEWVRRDDLAGLDMHPSMRQRIDDALTTDRPVLR